MKKIEDKKALLISPKFFGYEKSIQEELLRMSYNVTYINADPKNGLMTAIALLRRLHLPYKWLIKYFENYCYKRLESDQYDLVLIICGWAITSALVEKLRRSNLNERGKMVLYYWDSIELLKDDPKRLNYFDSVYSFDPNDCARSNGKIHFLPLFYTWSYHPLEERLPHRYNLMTVGSYKLNRYLLIETLKKINPQISIFSFMYIDRWLFEFHKLFRPKLKKVKREDLAFRKMTQEEIMETYRNCDAVLDIPKTGQKGLTIRTFECLAMNKKIITTNESIKTYDFYNPNNIYIVEEDRYELPSKEWFQKPYLLLDESVLKKYRIDNWLYLLLK